jgi:Flp pilus assembly protein TadD
VLSGLVALIVVALAAATAGADAERGEEGLADAAAVAIGGSPTGNFLAARHARSRHDYPAAADFLLTALRQAPDERSLLAGGTLALIVNGRIEAAAEASRQVADDDDPLAPLILAVDELRKGRAAEAASHAQSLKQGPVARVLGAPLRAWSLYGAGRGAEARSELEAALGRKGSDDFFRLHLALLSDLEGDIAAAARDYEAAGRDGKGTALRGVELYGNFLERTGRHDQAAELYRAHASGEIGRSVLTPAIARAEAAAAAPPIVASAAEGAAEALFGVAAAMARQNGQESALALGRLGLSLRPDFPLLQVLTAQLLESFERYDDANRVYTALPAGSGLAWQARLNTAANLNRLDRTDEAIAMLRGMADERPDDAEPLIEIADILRGRERFAEAVVAYDAGFARLPAIDKERWGLLYARGIALERTKQWDRAEADFLKALEFEPEQPLVLNYLGYSWIEQGRHLERAMDMVRKAVGLRPNDGYIVDSLGWAHYQLGNFPEAVRELERAVELRPEDPVINDHLGDAYWMVGRRREARYQWQAALALKPEPDVKAAIEEKLVRGLMRTVEARPRE